MPLPSTPNGTTRNYNYAAAQRVATTAASAQSAVVGAGEVLLIATAALWIATGTNPTAAKDTAGNMYLGTGEKFHMQIDPSFKIAAIQDTAVGALHIIPVG